MKIRCVMKFPRYRTAQYQGLSRRGIIHSGRWKRTEFVTLVRFDPMEAVKEFAGMDESKPVIYPKAEALLARMDERSHHYRIAISRSEIVGQVLPPAI